MENDVGSLGNRVREVRGEEGVVDEDCERKGRKKKKVSSVWNDASQKLTEVENEPRGLEGWEAAILTSLGTEMSRRVGLVGDSIQIS